MIGRMGRNSIPKFKPRPAIPIGRDAVSFSYVRQIAYLPSRDVAACGAVAPSYVECCGKHCCRHAHNVCIDSLERFHAAQPEEEWITHLLYIVAASTPVTTHACCARVQGRLRQLPRAEIIEHMAMENSKVEFLVAQQFRRQHEDVYSAIISCCGLADSNCKVVNVRKSGEAPARRMNVSASGEVQVHVDSLQSLWEWVKSSRRLLRTRHARIFWRNEVPSSL